jgi:hypothetical protein
MFLTSGGSNILANGVTSLSQETPSMNSAYGASNHTFFASGVFGTGGNVQIQISPDAMVGGSNGPGVADASSRWFTLANLTAASPFYVAQNTTYRKARAVVSAGDGTTALQVEMV